MVEVKACRGEVASRLESARDVLNILTVSPVDKLGFDHGVGGGVGRAQATKGCATRRLKGGVCAGK